MIPFIKDLLFSKETFLGYVVGLPAALAGVAVRPPSNGIEWAIVAASVLSCGVAGKVVQSGGMAAKP